MKIKAIGQSMESHGKWNFLLITKESRMDGMASQFRQKLKSKQQNILSCFSYAFYS